VSVNLIQENPFMDHLSYLGEYPFYQIKYN